MLKSIEFVLKREKQARFKKSAQCLVLFLNEDPQDISSIHIMMRIQFVKAAPTAIVRGEWFAVELRIVNESNGCVKITSKVTTYICFQFCSCNSLVITQISASVSLVNHIGALFEGNSILDATSESPSLFVECSPPIL